MRVAGMAWGGCFLLGSLFLLIAVGMASGVEKGIITQVAQYDAFVADPTDDAVPVSIDGVVTYVDRGWGMLFLQDETGGLYVDPPEDLSTSVTAGAAVTLTGVTRFENQWVSLNDVQIVFRDYQPYPQPIAVTQDNFKSNPLSARWIEIECVVRHTMEVDDRLQIKFMRENTPMVSHVRHLPDQAYPLSALTGSRVKVRGVCSYRYNAGNIEGVALFIPELSNITILERIPKPAAEMPVTPLKQIPDPTSFSAEAAPFVRVRGVVRGKRNQFIMLEEDGHFIQAATTGVDTAGIGDRVDVWGFPEIADYRVVLQDAICKTIESPADNARPTAADDLEPGLLQSIREVRSLSPNAAASHIPVRIRGVVSYADPFWQNIFLLDDTGGIYVQGWQDGIVSGDAVEIEGQTEIGDINNIIVASRIRRVGEGTLPEPARVSFSLLFSTEYDCAYVEQEGVVRSVDDEPNHGVLQIVTEQGNFSALIPHTQEGAAFRHLINSKILVRGVVALQKNDLRQLAQFELRVAGLDSIRVLRPAPADPFQEEVFPIAYVKKTDLALLGMQKIHVRGVVTLIYSENRFYIQDSTGAIEIQSSSAPPIPLGATVDVVGFPTRRRFSICLEESDVVSTDSAMRIEPALVRVEDILPEGRYDGEWVRLEGRLINDAGGTDFPSLSMQSGSEVFQARFESGGQPISSSVWRANSLLSLTGVCLIQKNEKGEARGFSLLLRRPEDVTVLQQPPWWTPRHAIALGGGLLALVLGALFWVILLRRTVRERTAQIQKQIESEAFVEKRLALVWESSTEGMRLTNAEGIVVQVNEAYCRIMRLRRQELEGNIFIAAYTIDDIASTMKEYKDAFSKRAIAPWMETEVTLRDGAKLWFELNNGFLEQPDGSTLLLSQIRDNTKRHRAEVEKENLQEQLLQAQKMEAVGQLAGGVAHDFNNILAVILGYCEMLDMEIPADAPWRGELKQITDAAVRAKELTRQLLAFSRKQLLEFKPLNINDLINGMEGLLKRLLGEDVDLQIHTVASVGYVRADAAQLEQILMNLCVNSRHAMPEGGVLTLETEMVKLDGRISGSGLELTPGSFVVLSVRDTGHGIDEETLPHIFNPFFTTKDKGAGTGLGLSTVYGIVKQHGGDVAVESRMNEGTRFRIYLPETKEAAVALQEQVAEPVLLGQGESILVLEDNEAVRELTCRMLANLGYHVVEARHAEECLELAQSVERIDLLLTDVIMPDLNGRQVYERVLKIRPDIKVLYMSGYTEDVVAPHGVLDAGIFLLRKPFNASELAQMVRNSLTYHPI